MKAEKVYAVELNSGEYDEFCFWIDCIFKDKHKAEKFAKKIISKAKRIKNKCPNINNEVKYWRYYTENKKEMDFNNATIKEYILK